jgi:DeoR family transcriptional regulator of aga operon
MVRSGNKTTVDRRLRILTMLSARDQVFVPELSRKFGVSEVTIRNDLEQLEMKHLLIRARGGAMRIDHVVGLDQRLAEKAKLFSAEKSRIGKEAAKLIRDSDTIIFDSGTTTLEVVNNIPPDIKNLTVITNALNIANHLIQNENINLIIPGGALRRNSISLVGPVAEKNFRNFYVDKAFLGVDSFDTRHGISTPNIEEASLNQVMIEVSREVIIVTDSSKFLRRSLAFICKIDSIHAVVTDTGISADDRKRLEDAGIELITV